MNEVGKVPHTLPLSSFQQLPEMQELAALPFVHTFGRLYRSTSPTYRQGLFI